MPRSRMSPRHRRLLMLLVQARKDAALSQVDLAQRLSRPQSFVSKVESGERRLDVIEFIEVCEALGCDGVAMLRNLIGKRRA